MIPNGLFMQILVAEIVTKTGLTPATAEKAVGILFNLLVTQGDKPKVGELFNTMPGAEDLARKHGGDGAGGGGLMGILAGGLMGGPLAMITKLQAIGLSMDQIKQVGTLTLNHAKAAAGTDAVRAAVANIPGVNTYI
jgi:predicted lipid-binding transport protein (Tim44 family)